MALQMKVWRTREALQEMRNNGDICSFFGFVRAGHPKNMINIAPTPLVHYAKVINKQ